MTKEELKKIVLYLLKNYNPDLPKDNPESNFYSVNSVAKIVAEQTASRDERIKHLESSLLDVTKVFITETEAQRERIKVLTEALEKLIELKDIKHGLPEYYARQKPVAWENARQALK